MTLNLYGKCSECGKLKTKLLEAGLEWDEPEITSEIEGRVEAARYKSLPIVEMDGQLIGADEYFHTGKFDEIIRRIADGKEVDDTKE